MPRNGIAGSYSSSIFNFWRNILTVLHGSYTSLHSCQQYRRFVFSPYLPQHLFEDFFFYIAILSFNFLKTSFSSVQLSCSVVSNSLWSHEPQTRPLCPLPTPGVHPNPCPLSQWCHPTTSCCPLFLLPSIFPIIRVFSNESALGIRWPKYWSFSFSISPSNEHLGLISFRMDWLDFLAVKGTLKSLL